MAKRMKSKIQPAELKISFVHEGGSSYIDLSQAASIVNRRFYRQGLNWGVSHFTITKTTPTEENAVSVLIERLPNTWVMSNSWEKGFRHWMKMNKEALESSESVKPKFLDFKVYADAAHHQLGFAQNLLPITNTAGPAQAGEWSSSKISIPLTTPAGVIDVGETVEREVVATGRNYPGVSAVTGFDALSLIEGYAASRSLPDISDPNTPSDAADAGGSTPENWIAAMNNDGTNQDSDVLDTMITENTIAPYPFENDGNNFDTQYPGGANQMAELTIHDVNYFNAGTHANKVSLEGGSFPCGLIKITSADELAIIVNLIPGSHRGYMAESMVDM